MGDGHVLPDLLPRTFHLAESSVLFSQINNAEPFEINEPVAVQTPEPEYSVVAIRESSLSEPKKPTFASDTEPPKHPFLTPKIGEINTVSILEIVDYFEPEFVETVHIIDATSETSDTDTSNTPVFGESRNRVASEEAVVSTEMHGADAKFSPKVLKVERKKMKVPVADRERAKPGGIAKDDRDILHDSEMDVRLVAAAKLKKKPIVPRLKEDLSPTGRDSFYNSDHENFDEPLIFSDDDDADATAMQSSEMLSTDDDSDDDGIAEDTVFIHPIQFRFSWTKFLLFSTYSTFFKIIFSVF